MIAPSRALAPDLARGLMLLLIVVSNTSFFLIGVAEGSTADRVARQAIGMLVDLRSYPLFAFLVGYGLVQASRNRAVRLLRRRGLWMMLFGLVHATFLLSSDVLGVWGLLTVVLSWAFLQRRDRVLVAWCCTAVGILLLAVLLTNTVLADVTVPVDSSEQSTRVSGTGEPSYWASIPQRWASWMAVNAITLALLTAPVCMLLGILAARRRILEEPGKHLRLLGWTAGAGLTIGILGALPHVLSDPGQLHIGYSVLHAVTGPGVGLGYAAVFALLAYWLPERLRRSLPVTAITAVGKRSLSTYLTHSLLFAPVLAAWGLGFGRELTQSTMVAFALAVWLVTVVLAYLLERAGRQGPAETLLRWLIYRREVSVEDIKVKP